MAKVWVTQETSHSLCDAQRFGRIEFITRFDYVNYSSDANSRVRSDFANFLKKYKQKEDFILLTGSPINNVILAATLPHGKHNFLKWSGRDKKYIDYLLNL